MTTLGLWIYLVIWLVRLAFENASDSKWVRVLIMTWLYMQGLHRVLHMSEYGSIWLSNNWVCLNVLISLNMPENTWMNCFDYARVYKMSHLRNLTWFWAFLTDLSKAFDCLFHELMPTALVSFIIIYLTGNKELRLIMISVHEKWFYLECLKVLCLGPHYPISVLVICFL